MPSCLSNAFPWARLCLCQASNVFEPSGFLPALALEFPCRRDAAARSGPIRSLGMLGQNLSFAQLNGYSISRDDEPSRVNDRLPVEIDRILPILA